MEEKLVILFLVLFMLLISSTATPSEYTEPKPTRYGQSVPWDWIFPSSFFKFPKTIAVYGQNALVSYGDFNHDGLEDIVVSSANNPFTYSSISILYNNGDGSFKEEKISYFGSIYIKDINVADYDGDGDLDVLFTYDEIDYTAGRYMNGTINLLVNDNGNFNKFRQIDRLLPYNNTNATEKWTNICVSSADFDGDGDIDFLVGGNCGEVLLYKNDGTGNFNLSNKIYDYGTLSWGIESADFNNDGLIDFIVAANHSIYLKLNDGSSDCFNHSEGIYLGRIPTMPYTIGSSAPTAALAAMDYNNDGWMDFVCGAGDALFLFINRNLTFRHYFICELPSIPLSDSNKYASDRVKGWFFHIPFYYATSLDHHALTALDIDGDGYTDLVSGGTHASIRYFINNKTFVSIILPEKGRFYLFGNRRSFVVNPIHKTYLFNVTLIVGMDTINFTAEGLEPLQKVEFYLDGKLMEVDTEPPYEWSWKCGRKLFFSEHVVSAVAYRLNGEFGGKTEMIIWKFF